MIGAGFANKVTLLFRKHTVKAIFTRRRCHVDSEHNPAVGARSGVEADDRKLSDMEEGKEETDNRKEEVVASQEDTMKDEEALKQTSMEAGEEDQADEEGEALKNEGEAMKNGSREVDGKWKNRITLARDDEITSEQDEDTTTATCDCADRDADMMKFLVHQILKDAFIGVGDSDLKGIIHDSLMQAVKEYHDSASVSSGNSIAPVDMMKLVKEAMTEHQTFSRVLYVLALGTPITLVIARTVRGNDDKCPDNTMIRNSALEMGFSFLAATVCHLYIIIFHFVRTEAPRLSMCFTRLIIALLCTVMSSWILLYTFYIPQALFKAFFWWVIGPFLALNWFLSVPIGCTGCLTEKSMIKV
ncbi:hypothetical protein PVAP13_6KG140200 [Panicum virgatum]|uniref:Uncharacterized protein n=1 Tax=Panicum virgatum TaxID=38727 RepID=A0A8T0RDQ5_PANVG|nr:hypothetical protein PVAP13_6KG140200 [Panicum virgatum]KAG2583336.1 hypothetical protein PVAP13_6KG140200 [Panicum virgatum]